MQELTPPLAKVEGRRADGPRVETGLLPQANFSLGESDPKEDPRIHRHKSSGESPSCSSSANVKRNDLAEQKKLRKVESAGSVPCPTPILHHLFDQKEETEKRYGCKDCRRGFSRLFDCKRHEETHGSKKWLCAENDCAAPCYLRKDALIRHIRKKHDEKNWERLKRTAIRRSVDDLE
ncbi:hypothetical protein B0H17DRAFT_1037645 [Mycena rosella]|uniref:C2H2-type domain-containing protein n=1 Tax=Mycena rosella TaxID=1033263 RepID=A0AAD7GU67_MYCRO|nr:hypothetical protein B0H17DRAFT_1037645 [Mycena rosella]